MTDAEGLTTAYAYDAYGNKVSMTTYRQESGTPRQAWLNYHDERNMNHKQTEM